MTDDDDCTATDPSDAMSRRVAELAAQLHTLAGEVRARASQPAPSRASTAGAPPPSRGSSPQLDAGRGSSVRLSGSHLGHSVAAFDFDDADEQAPRPFRPSVTEVRAVLDAIDTEAASGRGPGDDVQRAVG